MFAKLAVYVECACSVAFSWFAVRACFAALAIAHGWHRHAPDGITVVWTMFLDGALALLFWHMERSLEQQRLTLDEQRRQLEELRSQLHDDENKGSG